MTEMTIKTSRQGPTGQRWVIEHPTDEMRAALNAMPNDARLDVEGWGDAMMVVTARSRRAMAYATDAVRAGVPKANPTATVTTGPAMATPAQRAYLRTLIEKHRAHVVGELVGDAFPYPTNIESLTRDYASTLIDEMRADLGWY